jgi:hypothetical protein
MSESIFPQLAQQLVCQSPVFLVYLVAFVLALVYLRKAPLASTLTLVGVVVLVASGLAVGVIQMLLIQSHRGGSQGAVNLGQMVTLVSMVGCGFHAIGLALLVAAVFVGRRPPVAKPARSDDPFRERNTT